MTFERPDIGSYAALPQSGLEGLVDEQPAGRLAGLSQLVIADQDTFVAAMAECGQKS